MVVAGRRIRSSGASPAALSNTDRRSKNLPAEPKLICRLSPISACHQRLLDGLVAGGAFLVRAHPADTLMQELTNFLAEHANPKAQSISDAKASISPALHMAFDELLERCAFVAELGDPVAVIRSCENAAILVPQQSALPHLDAVSFHDAATFKAKLKWMLDNPAERMRIAEAQRRNVEDRLSYTAGLRRVVNRIYKLLSTEQQVSGRSSAAFQRVA